MTSEKLWSDFRDHVYGTATVSPCPNCTDEDECPVGRELLRRYEAQLDREEAEEDRADDAADQGWRGSEPLPWRPER